MATSQSRTDKYNEAYWSGLAEGVLRMPRCRNCARLQYPMGPCCSHCLGEEFEWIRLSGRGKVYSYVVYHHAFHPSFKHRLPYNVVEIALEEGVKVISNVVGIEHAAITNGMPVHSVFEWEGEVPVLRFRPIHAEPQDRGQA
ncbi:MAG: Zn-ribbon domain-containing OB-fold protein [Pigmentiphaga sp.]